MKKIILIFVLAMSIPLLYSQVAYRADSIIVNNEIMGRLTIENYSNIILYKGEKCNFPNNTAEYKFCNFFNLNTKEELTTFFSPNDIPSSYNKNDYLDKMKIYNNRNNFYSLDSKYTFDNGISKDIFIKFINHNEAFKKPVYSVFYLQNFNNSLIVKNIGENFDFGLFLISSNTDKTINYLNNIKTKEIDITKFCNDFLDNIKSHSNKNVLFEIIDKNYSPFFDNKDGSALNENVLSSIFTCTYVKTFHDIVNGIVLEKNEISKIEIAEKYNIPVNYLTKDSLAIKEVINVNTINNDFTIIKFYDFQPIIKTDFGILNNTNVLNNNLLFVLTKLDFEFFVSFCFDENNKKFPELKEIKSLTKNSNGTLNIFNLVKIIEKDNNALSKYIEE